jgi:arylsulfatase A
MFSGKKNLLFFVILISRTLADLVDYNPTCNEGPDSRSLLRLLSGESENIPGPEEVLTHAIKGNSPTAIRWYKWKLIPGSREFFDMEKDPSEENNLWDKPWAGVIIEKLQGILDSRLESIAEREERTNLGQLDIC